MRHFLAFAFLLGFAPLHAFSQTCTDVRQLDLRNMTIHLGDADENELTGLFNSSAGSATFHMRGGQAVSFEAFNADGNGSEPEHTGNPDWRAEIVVDRTMRPDSSSQIRFLVIENVHMTGTGAWRYIVGFTCREKTLVPIFKFSGEGVSLEHLDQRTLRMNQAVWAPNDAHADPSLGREVTYQWESRRHRYVRTKALGPNAALASWQPDEKGK